MSWKYQFIILVVWPPGNPKCKARRWWSVYAKASALKQIFQQISYEKKSISEKSLSEDYVFASKHFRVASLTVKKLKDIFSKQDYCSLDNVLFEKRDLTRSSGVISQR